MQNKIIFKAFFQFILLIHAHYLAVYGSCRDLVLQNNKVGEHFLLYNNLPGQVFSAAVLINYDESARH